MQKNILQLSQEFISIESTPSNAKALEEILELALSQLQDFTIERFEHNGVLSALVYNRPTRPETFDVVLAGHLDIIPGKAHQHIPEVRGSRLYGVGSMDMKANAACLIAVFKEVASTVPYPLALQLTTDEEVGGFDGAKYQVEQGLRTHFVIAGEPTNFDIVNKAKGILQLKITAPGQTAHGAYPWKGDNAIWKMTDFLNALKDAFPIPSSNTWSTTVNLSGVGTHNRSFNKVPDDCSVWLDVRFIPEDMGSIKTRIQSLLPPGFILEVVTDEPALFTDEHDPYIQALVRSTQLITGQPAQLRGANGSSDARHFTSVGCPGIEFGPIGDGIGSDSEWVDIPSLESYCQILTDFLRTIKAD